MSAQFSSVWPLTLCFMLSLANHCNADIVFNSNVQANFTFTTVGTTLGLPDGQVLPFTAFGSMTFTLDDSVPGATSMSFLGASGSLTVASPFPGAVMGPYSFIGGQLQGITYDLGGNITGGQVVDLSMRWEMYLGPTRLYTKVGLPFGGTITGVPFDVGNVLSGPAEFDVFRDDGNSLTDPLVVIGKDRFLTITAVPEPSSFALLALGICAGVRFRTRQRLWWCRA